MNIIKTEIPDVLILEPKVFGDHRGFFYESFNQKIFEDAVGYPVNFVQDNHSKSSKGVLRGLHYQKAPHAQGKLVRCVHGEVFDVAVDIRPESNTYGKWVSAILSAKNKRQLWIPEGFAHGFLVLSDEAEFLYKATNFYHPKSESNIIWNDPYLNIVWPIKDRPTLSEKDKTGICFNKLIGM
ncbi:dTDP-4-dehydrorhamnose 3,5-epimerase [Proteus mirabilis]|uniref:dTDP-4-dehydrorhamnose 3,5-epimerase n=1 Tax=Proteus mirabilis TaxID=584 RepID=UPI00155F4115|nr:dTDP-4-dehydrorhamnose 3,5-epimerase [Proteus mirabilis]ELB1101882.1 dTDP-4-dehydrorhamnose 3,5-epimerase [Proteus mirabilis]QKG47386.1 dTDP-4-dehydrorhamnose 3,5-epimerase [Proteus mirabilis]WDQ24393.1 dTDP-4-dehydrorhamnose 3,5-epimerase [Proteus mirabilis]